jgi:ribonuclease HII
MSPVQAKRSAPTDTDAALAIDTLHVGVDEAGYGPNLGPLVIAANSFVGSAELESADWWKLLRDAVGRANTRRPLILDDSKRVLARRDGRARLAQTVACLLKLVDIDRTPLVDIVQSIAPSDVDALTREHWYVDDRPPAGKTLEDLSPLFHATLAGARLRFRQASACLLFPETFNERVDALGNKATLEAETVARLLRQELADLDHAVRRIDVTVDRLGGRRYYAPLVEELVDGALVMTVQEDADRSIYRTTLAGRDLQVQFRVKGDQHSMPVAAASLVAKYLRERCMEAFNQHWMAQVDGLAPTAGYPSDAPRFRDAVASLLADRGITMDAFWRRR